MTLVKTDVRRQAVSILRVEGMGGEGRGEENDKIIKPIHINDGWNAKEI
jgi:hypothetical protein